MDEEDCARIMHNSLQGQQEMQINILKRNQASRVDKYTGMDTEFE